MKKLVLRFIITAIFIAVLWIIFCDNPEAVVETVAKDPMTVDYNFTELSEEEMFFKPAHNYSNINSENTEAILYNTFYAQVIDTEFKPIEDAKLNLYNENGEFIESFTTNSNGEVGLSNLKRNTKYYIKQATTRNGLVADSEQYSFTPDDAYSNTYCLYFINADKELTDDEKSKYRNEYEDVLDDNTAHYEDKLEYLFLKEEIKYKDLYLLFYNNLKSTENSKRGLRVEVRIPSAEIRYIEIEKIKDDKKIVEILDKDGKEKNTFNDPEFYMTIDRTKSVTNVDYNIKVFFEYDGSTYYISKKLDIDQLRYSPQGIATIDLFNKDNNERLDKSLKVFLAEIDPETGEVINEERNTEIGETGKRCRGISIGTYKFYIMRNGERLYSDPFEITNGDTVAVDMYVSGNNEVTTRIEYGNRLQIKAVDKEGKPVEGVKYSVYNKAGNYVVIDVITDENGIAIVNNLNEEVTFYVQQADSKDSTAIDFIPLREGQINKTFIYDRETNKSIVPQG